MNSRCGWHGADANVNRSKLGISDLNSWTVKCLDLSRFPEFHEARNALSDDGSIGSVSGCVSST